MGKLAGTDTQCTNNASGNYAEWFKFSCGGVGDVVQIRLYSLVTGHAKVAIYNDNAGVPGSRLGKQDTSTPVTANQWNKIPLESPVGVYNGYVVWLAFITDTDGAVAYNSTGGNRGYKAETYAGYVWPATAPSVTSDVALASIAGWEVLELAPSSISQPISIGEPQVRKTLEITLAAGISQAISIGEPAIEQACAAVPDLPDWTDSMNIVASRLNLPMFIKGTMVNLPISVEAWTIGTLSVDIVAQAIGNLLISVAAQSVGVYLQPEWAAKTGVDKNLFAFANNQALGGSAYTTYTVTAGKTFYLCGVGGALVAYAAADYDHHLYARLSIVDVTTATVLARFGGLGGAAISLNKPMAIPAAHEFRVYCYNHANVNCNIDVSAWGYEV